MHLLFRSNVKALNLHFWGIFSHSQNMISISIYYIYFVDKLLRNLTRYFGIFWSHKKSRWHFWSTLNSSAGSVYLWNVWSEYTFSRKWKIVQEILEFPQHFERWCFCEKKWFISSFDLAFRHSKKILLPSLIHFPRSSFFSSFRAVKLPSC